MPLKLKEEVTPALYTNSEYCVPELADYSRVILTLTADNVWCLC